MHVSIEGDRGGNDIEVLWRGERHTNFHRVWDSEIILDYMSEQWGWAPEATRWSYFADELASEIPLNGVDILTPLDPIAWAQESHDIVRSSALPVCSMIWLPNAGWRRWVAARNRPRWTIRQSGRI